MYSLKFVIVPTTPSCVTDLVVPTHWPLVNFLTPLIYSSEQSSEEYEILLLPKFLIKV